MGNEKWSDWGNMSALDGTEEIPGLQGGDNLLTTTQDIADLAALGYQILHARDEKANTTVGGTATTTTWTTSVLLEESNTISGASMASNQITLPAGTYEINAYKIFYQVNNCKIKLYNITDATDIIIGTSKRTAPANQVAVDCKCYDVFTLDDTKVLELQYYVSATTSTNDLGYPTSSGDVEVYADAIITKLA